MEKLANTKVSKIVARNYKTAQVFSSYGIDFCCNGGISLEQACHKQGLNIKVVEEEIIDALAKSEVENFSEMPLDELVQHIRKVHHTYVKNNIPAINSYLNKLCKVHGERHPELLKIRELFTQSAKELMQHMENEEQILFPYIQAMVASRQGNFKLSPPHFGHLQNPISMMESEHQNEGARFDSIEKLSNGYQPPDDACQTYKVTYMMLKEFEKDLHKHIHLENNLLFPPKR